MDAVIESNGRDETAAILKTLSPKEEKVIRLRFGIGCEREHTLEEIGQEFDVTRERIRRSKPRHQAAAGAGAGPKAARAARRPVIAWTCGYPPRCISFRAPPDLFASRALSTARNSIQQRR